MPTTKVMTAKKTDKFWFPNISSKDTNVCSTNRRGFWSWRISNTPTLPKFTISFSIRRVKGCMLCWSGAQGATCTITKNPIPPSTATWQSRFFSPWWLASRNFTTTMKCIGTSICRTSNSMKRAHRNYHFGASILKCTISLPKISKP